MVIVGVSIRATVHQTFKPMEVLCKMYSRFFVHVYVCVCSFGILAVQDYTYTVMSNYQCFPFSCFYYLPVIHNSLHI